jgi:SAM-dependent methyltransferase
MGYTVHGVDLSKEMLETASKLKNVENLSFSQGDVRNARLNRTFDTVTSLFHVMSYQISNEDLFNSFDTAYQHLSDSGIFIFDCWYGPAVLSDRPTVRVKRFEDTAMKVTRIAEPVMHANENVVDVNYTILIKDKISLIENELTETHQMRYLFKPEVEGLLNRTGFILEGFFEYMTGKVPGYDTWNVCFVGRKK